MGVFFSQLLSLLQGYILAPLIWLLPLKWVVVAPGSAAVRLTFGRIGTPLLGGCIVLGTTGQTLLRRHVRRLCIATNSVQALTADGIPIEADILITYSVANLAEMLVAAEDPEEFLAAIAEARALATLQGSSLAQLTGELHEVQEGMLELLGAEAKDLGIRILTVRFQNLRHLDPFVRAASTAPVAALRLTEAAETLAEDLGITRSCAVSVLAPSITMVHSVGGVVSAAALPPEEDSGSGDSDG